MKEYEYIVGALEGYLCEQLASVICMENYENNPHPHGYRRIFDEYIELRNEFQNEKFEKNEFPNEEWKQKAKEILDSFVESLGNTVNDVELEDEKNKYLHKLYEEENITLGKKVGIYPYITKKARENL